MYLVIAVHGISIATKIQLLLKFDLFDDLDM